MKGGLAAMMLALHDVARNAASACASSACPTRSPRTSTSAPPTRWSREGFIGDFAITGEPTDLHVGIQAKGVLAFRLNVHGRAAHSSTPWLGDNAVLKAIDVFRRIESLPFSRESSELFDRPVDQPRPDQRRGRAQQGPRPLLDGRRHPLPAQPGSRGLLAQIRSIPDIEVVRTFIRAPAYVSRTNPFVRRAVRRGRRHTRGESMSIGRDGASDAISFLTAGSRRSSSARPARATTGPRSGCRSRRWRATARRCRSSSPSCPAALDRPTAPSSCAPSRAGSREPRSEQAARGWALSMLAKRGARRRADRARDGRRGVGRRAAAGRRPDQHRRERARGPRRDRDPRDHRRPRRASRRR